MYVYVHIFKQLKFCANNCISYRLVNMKGMSIIDAQMLFYFIKTPFLFIFGIGKTHRRLAVTFICPVLRLTQVIEQTRKGCFYNVQSF